MSCSTFKVTYQIMATKFTNLITVRRVRSIQMRNGRHEDDRNVHCAKSYGYICGGVFFFVIMYKRVLRVSINF
jgi:hypothetical protein